MKNYIIILNNNKIMLKNILAKFRMDFMIDIINKLMSMFIL